MANPRRRRWISDPDIRGFAAEVKSLGGKTADKLIGPDDRYLRVEDTIQTAWSKTCTDAVKWSQKGKPYIDGPVSAAFGNSLKQVVKNETENKSHTEDATAIVSAIYDPHLSGETTSDGTREASRSEAIIVHVDKEREMRKLSPSERRIIKHIEAGFTEKEIISEGVASPSEIKKAKKAIKEISNALKIAKQGGRMK